MILPPAHGGPLGRGEIKRHPEDFQVTESMPVTLEGEGEHLWLHIEKTGWNTEAVALWLAGQAGVHRLAVGYSGLKDKHAITRQWFSVQLPGKADPALSWPAGLKLIEANRHRRKLNRGTHRANRFVIRVRDVTGDGTQLEDRLTAIADLGVPNYVGQQRFGREQKNLYRGRDWLLGGEAPRKRALRSLWLSAVRSDLFNRVLAARVEQSVWDRLLPGDILQPAGSRGLFAADEEPQAAQRLHDGSVHPTAPMPGVPGMASSGACRQLETAALAEQGALIDRLAALGVAEHRRATRLVAQDLRWHWEPSKEGGGRHLILAFDLPTGAFATTVLAELLLPQQA